MCVWVGARGGGSWGGRVVREIHQYNDNTSRVGRKGDTQHEWCGENECQETSAKRPQNTCARNCVLTLSPFIFLLLQQKTNSYFYCNPEEPSLEESPDEALEESGRVSGSASGRVSRSVSRRAVSRRVPGSVFRSV